VSSFALLRRTRQSDAELFLGRADRKMDWVEGGRSGGDWGCLQGDGVAERLELADEVAGSSLFVDAAGVEVGAEVAVAGAGLGDDYLGGVDADAGDFVQAGDDWQRCAVRVERVATVTAAVVGNGCLGGRDLDDQLVDAERERLDLGGEGVDLVEQQPGELGVV